MALVPELLVPCLALAGAALALPARGPAGAPVPVAAASAAAGPAASQDAASPPALRVLELLDNGDFEDAPPRAPDPAGVRRVPWWRTAAGAEQLADGGLRTGPGLHAEQPLALPASALETLALAGTVAGAGRLVLVDGRGERRALPVSGAFALDAADLAAAFGGAPVPRLTLRLESDDPATWDDLSARVALPLPSEAALRDEVLAELDRVLALWAEHGVDPETGLLVRLWDVVTGEPLMELPGTYSIFSDVLLAGAARLPRHRPLAERHLDSLLELCQHPETGLPRRWDPTRGPLDDEMVEVHAQLDFLMDVADGRHGTDAARRARCEAVLARAVETILRTGPQPDGELAARYRPRDGATDAGAGHLRRLDVPARLARHVRRGGDPAALLPVRDALATFLYAHAWAGDWLAIDPGFDDNFGHWGERGLDLWRADPDDALLREVTRSGVDYYAPRWRDTLRLGGNVAADQVRCWRILRETCELEPARLDALAPLLGDALRSHWKGQQYAGGAWGDVTVVDFEPRPHLQVGDTAGVPQNLLFGIAALYDAELAAHGGPGLDELRARFHALLRSSRAHYGRAHGTLSSRTQVVGANRCGGSLRLAVGLVELLERLEGR